MLSLYPAFVYNFLYYILMGNKLTGSTKFKYTLKSGEDIQFIYYDLKGKNRYPPEPSEDVTEARFQACLKQINISPENQDAIEGLSSKYKHRFVFKYHETIKQLTQQKLKKQKDKIAPKPTAASELQNRLTKIQQCPSILKTLLNELQKYLKQKQLYKQFMEMGGINRLVLILERQQKKNREGIQNNFNNQIEILRLLNQFSKEKQCKWLFMAAIQNVPNYFMILLKSFHPINISVTVPILELSILYLWKTSTEQIQQQLQQYRKLYGYSWSMQPFTDTLIITNNIVMVYHILKFINEFVGSLIEEEKSLKLKQQLKRNRFQMILVTIRSRIQQKWYKIQYCTFDYIHRRLFDYKSKSNGRTEGIDKTILNEIFAKANRTSAAVNLEALIVNMIEEHIDDGTTQLQELDDEEENLFLQNSDQKRFGKFVVNTLKTIQYYFQIEEKVVGNNPTSMNQLQQKQISDAFKSLKQACRDSQCEDILLQTFRGLQNFGRSNWVQLQNFMQESRMGISKSKSIDPLQDRQLEMLKSQNQNKDKMIKTLLKDNNEIKFKFENLRNTMMSSSLGELEIKKYQSLAPSLPQDQQSIPNLASDNIIPTLPTLPTLPAPPSLTSTSSIPPVLPPPPNLSLSISSPLPPPPPPPTLSSLNTLPPLPPPPSFGSVPSTIPSTLPPPPSFGSIPSTIPSTLPPPPTLTPLLSAPPSLGSLLPPPPGIGLPPPPGMIPAPPIGLPPITGLPPIGGLPLIGISTTKLKQKCKPSKPLKGCNVANLPYQKIKNSIWQQIDDTKVQIDKEMLQALFAKPQITKSSSIPLQKVQKVQIVPKKEKVRLIEGQRSKNIQIILTKMRAPSNILCDALRLGTGKYSTTTVLQSVYKILPTDDQESLMKTYNGDVQQLAAPERFFVQVTKVPGYRARIKALLFRDTYEQLLQQIEQKQNSLKEVFTQVKTNKRLHDVLETALALSNYLNGTTIKGGAWGFKIDSIERFQEVKSIDGKDNLAFVLIKQVWKKYSHPIFDLQEVGRYKTITQISINQLSSYIQDLKQNLNFAKKALASQIESDPHDRIGDICQVIVDTVEGKLEEFTKSHEQTIEAYKSCAEFYCQDPTQSSQEFGKKVLSCILFICKSQETLHQLAEAKKKQEQRMAKKSMLTFKQPQKLPPKPPIQPPPTSPKIQQVESKIINQQPQIKQKFDFIQQMKRKRQTKREKVRNSRFSKAPGGLNSSKTDLQFSYLGFIPQ